jgi:hypothetical protein
MEWVVCGYPGNAMATLKVFFYSDCVFWCGRCTEPTLMGKKSVNQPASSPACDKILRRNGS